MNLPCQSNRRFIEWTLAALRVRLGSNERKREGSTEAYASAQVHRVDASPTWVMVDAYRFIEWTLRAHRLGGATSRVSGEVS
jgi:hypothetical protein